MTLTTTIIKDLDKYEFCRLFGYNIPNYNEAEYYIHNLSLSKEFEKIYSHVMHMSNFQEYIQEVAPEKSPKKFKMELLDKIVAKLKELGVPEKLNQINLNGHSFSNQKPTFEPGFFYVSLDLNEANWNVYKHFGGLQTDLNWKDWLTTEFDAPKALVESKTFRQIVFGHINPGRVSKLQEVVTKDNLEQAQKAFLKEHEGVVGVSHDELIIKFTEEQLFFGDDPVSFVHSILPRKFKIFTVNYVEHLNGTVRVDTVYEPLSLEKKYKSLKEVPGNIFWPHFKALILESEIEERDLLFKNEGRLAKWVM